MSSVIECDSMEIAFHTPDPSWLYYIGNRCARIFQHSETRFELQTELTKKPTFHGSFDFAKIAFENLVHIASMNI